MNEHDDIDEYGDDPYEAQGFDQATPVDTVFNAVGLGIAVGFEMMGMADDWQ
ncbi:hypothetical protein ACQUFY_05825 [Robbsia andropogonis]|uniref:hypothetical protein n=1 Tax=Robbsia andropogonis TaxID=28092 RepID=UPI003D24253B